MEKTHGNSESEVNLFEYLNVLRRRKKVICMIVGTVTILTIISSLLMTKYYRATAVIMPISKGGGSGLAVLAGQLGGLASLAGMTGAGTYTPAQQFISLLKTRTMAENIINKFDLMPILFKNYNFQDGAKPKTEDAVRVLLGRVQFKDDKKGGTVSISGEFKDPKLAADIVNGYVEGLQKFINDNAFTVAKRNRIFIENQLQHNVRELLEAGKELNGFYRAGKISSVDAKVDVPTPDNFKVSGEMLKDESKYKNIDELQQQKEDIENKILVRDVPQQVYLQYLTVKRSLLIQINALLVQQYEMAKIDEAKDELAFQVIDMARVPEKRSRPQRSRMVIMAFIASIFLGVFWAFFMERLEKIKLSSSRQNIE